MNRAAALLLLLLPATALAGPSVSLVTGEEREGLRLVRVDRGRAVLLDGDRQVSLPVTALAEAVLETGPAGEQEVVVGAPINLYLANGDRLRGTVSGEGNDVLFSGAHVKGLRVPLPSVRAIRFGRLMGGLQEKYRAVFLRELKKGKFVVASMGDVAASGGYYIAMNSNVILAEPQTITGSIGVVGIVTNVDDVYPWVGINPERMTRGKRAAAFMTTQSLSDDDKAVLRTYMKDFYGDFVVKVAAGRGKTPAEIHPIAQGRIWTGRTAKDIGLVDRLGGLEDAIAIARDRSGIKADAKFHVFEYPRRAGPFELLQEMMGGASLGLDSVALARLPLVKRILSHIAVLRQVAKDRICVIQPELVSLTTPFGY